MRKGQCGWNGRCVEQHKAEMGQGQVFIRLNLCHHLYTVLWLHLAVSTRGASAGAASAGWGHRQLVRRDPSWPPSGPEAERSKTRDKLWGSWGSQGHPKSMWSVHIISFLKICVCGPILKSLFTLLQYCSCFMFWSPGAEACGILDPWPETKPTHPALQSEVSAPGPPGKSPKRSYSYKQLFGTMLYYFSAPKRKLNFKWFKQWGYIIISHDTSSKWG